MQGGKGELRIDRSELGLPFVECVGVIVVVLDHFEAQFPIAEKNACITELG